MTNTLEQNRKIIAGAKIGRLTLLEHVRGSKKIKPKWLCRCDCGVLKRIPTQNIKSGKTKSCGCLSSQMVSARNAKHNSRYTDEYSCWSAMKTRCYNPNDNRFENYGGRGIAVCEEWLTDFSQFLKDMGERPSTKHSIERIDVDGNYEPSNCKWADNFEQARNKRIYKNNMSGVKGVCFLKGSKTWVAHWYRNGKHKTKSFSSSKYGDKKAFDLAVEARAFAIAELNKDEVNYG